MIDEDSSDLSAAQLEAQIKALKAKRDQQLEREKQAKRQRANGASSTATVIAPASPSPRKTRPALSAVDALRNPGKTRLAPGQLKKARHSPYDHPTAQPVASTSYAGSSSNRRDAARDETLENALADDDRARLARKQRHAPSSFLSGNDNARQSLKNKESQRGVAQERSSGFHDVAPMRKTMPIPPLPIGNAKGKGREQVSSNSNGTSTSTNINRYTRMEQGPTQDKNAGVFHSSDDEVEGEAPYRPIGNERDDRLALVNRLKPGPRHWTARASDPDWNEVEPNSGIWLKERHLPHKELQEALSDRFHLRPCDLYSIVRTSKGGAEYEVPVEGDWIVIGVLAEKSEIKYTGTQSGNAAAVQRQLDMRQRAEAERKRKARAAKLAKARAVAKAKKDATAPPGEDFDEAAFEDMIASDDELKEAFEGSDYEGAAADGTKSRKRRKKAKTGNDDEASESDEDDDKSKDEPPARRRYITFKLIDLKEQNAGGGSGVLSLKLFESDPSKRRQTKITHDEDVLEKVVNKRTGGSVLVRKEATSTGLYGRAKAKADPSADLRIEGDRYERKEYKGGSGGAFEKFWKARNGTVVAVLNPRIMKPWQTNNTQFNDGGLYSLTPDSADSVMVIGMSRDLATCDAKRKDGNLCGSWCDNRVLPKVCDYHKQQAASRAMASRPELLTGTGAMRMTSIQGDFDTLSRKTAPLPSGKVNNAASGKSQRGTGAYDPVSKTGLLPRNNASIVEGHKTYVVSAHSAGGAPRMGGLPRMGGAMPGSRNGRNGGFLGAPDRDERPSDPRDKTASQEDHRRHVGDLLASDAGSKSLGAKYLLKNGKALPRARKAVSADDEGATSHSELDQDGGGSDSAAEGAASKSKDKRRIFSTEAVRAIGWDPSLMPAEADPNKQKRKLDAIKVLGDPTSYEPKLNRKPGEKVRSGVRAPSSGKSTAAAEKKKEEVATVDDWEQLAQESEDENGESDLEIEPPVPA